MSAWLRGRWPADRGERVVLLALAALLAAGIALRLGFVLARRPAFLGNGDSYFYINAARESLFSDLIRPAGYPLFLRIVHLASPDLSFTILVQHVLGVATALLLFATVRRVVPGGWGLLPAAVVLLSAPVVILEHAVLTEAPFGVLIAGMCYCAARALDDRPTVWAASAGLFAGAATCVRALGLLFAFLLAAWLVVAVAGRLRHRLTVGLVAATCAWLPIVAYIGTAKHEAGYVGLGLSRLGGLNLYAGAAGFADCTKFTPPPGTRDLCEVRPPSARPGPFWYTLSSESPGLRRVTNVRAEDNAALVRFARAAMLHQPGDYLHKVAIDLSRFWSSEDHYRPLDGQTYEIFTRVVLTDDYPLIPGVVRSWYDTPHVHTRKGLLHTLRVYERHTRLEGPAFMLLVLLALVGVPFARGRRLSLGVLMVGASVVALVAPVATTLFDPRYAVPGYAPLAAAAAIGAATLWERAAGLLARRRGRAATPERLPV